MNGVSKKLILVLIPLLVLLLALGGVLVFLPDSKSSDEIYVEQINAARKLVESGDYQGAISHYKTAIEKDNTKEDPYLELARIYFSLNMTEEGLQTLRDGYTITRSLTILGELESHEAAQDETEPQQTAEWKGINDSFTDMFSSYSFSQYTEAFTLKDEVTVSDKYTVTYSQFEAEFTYENSFENTVLDPSTGKPYPFARPTSIHMQKLGQLIVGAENGVTAEDLHKGGAENVQIGGYDQALGCHIMTFTYHGLSFKVGCSEDGRINGDNAYNSVVPQPVKGEALTVKVFGKVTDRIGGKNISGATLKFRAGKSKRDGEVSVMETAYDGNYSTELEPGDYTVEISAEKYNTEFAELSIPAESKEEEKNFELSRKAGYGQVRMVVEWTDSKYDMGVHIKGIPSTGGWTEFWPEYGDRETEFIGAHDKGVRDGVYYDSATLFDAYGTYEFHVHGKRSKQDIIDAKAVVKLYVDDKAQPITIDVPSTISGSYWIVCRVEDGEIKQINGSQR